MEAITVTEQAYPDLPAPRDGEHRSEVISLDGDGPYPALVRPDPHNDDTVLALFTRPTTDVVVGDLNQLLSIYGGLAWSLDEPATVLVYQHADDTRPRSVRSDERGLYDLGLMGFWREHPVEVTS